jgi:hypothetical protein
MCPSKREARGLRGERIEDFSMMALKMEEGDRSQKI